jgi:hypothetical protein
MIIRITEWTGVRNLPISRLTNGVATRETEQRYMIGENPHDS